MSSSLKYVSSYSFILISSNQLKEIKKEKKDIIDILFTINRSILAELWHFKRERQLSIKLKFKVIMIYSAVFNVIIDVIKKKKDFRDKS